MILLSVPHIAGVWVLIQHAGIGGNNLGPITTAAIDTTGADLIVLGGQYYTAIGTPSDNKGNSWTLGIASGTGGGTGGAVLYYCRGGVAGAGHTFSWNGNYGPLQVLVFSGSAAVPQDQFNGSPSNAQPGSITPSVNNSLVISAAANASASINSIDSGFTLRSDLNLPFVSGPSIGGATAYLIQTVAAAINPTWSPFASGQFGSVIMSFKGA